jgi:uncharacterized membrane protein YhhN
VHHAVNDNYLDKNYGGILIVWDRLFGTFRDEDLAEPCVYGTRGALNSWDPLWANAEVYWALAKDSWHTRSWGDKLRVWLKPPGWRPADVAQRFPKPPFDMARVQMFEPAISPTVAWFAGLNFTVLLGGVIVFLWHADTLPLAQAALWFSALTAGLWAVGAVTQGRITVLEALLIQAAALATATSAAGLPDLYRVIKPLPMLIAIFLVATYDPLALGSGQKGSNFPNIAPSGRLWLLAALAGSLAGDVLLLFPGYFVPGLVAFLLAHVAYLVLLRQGAGWFPSRGALAATLGVGAAMYAFLWTGGLPAGLRAPVAAYVTVIALMAAQAIGRATVQRDAASWLVAVGACSFMLSDSLLATNKFVAPLPLASFWSGDGCAARRWRSGGPPGRGVTSAACHPTLGPFSLRKPAGGLRRCRYAASVAMRPRGVRCKKPCWIR